MTVQEVGRLGRNLLEGLIVLNDLFQRGIGVKVLEGVAAGEHTDAPSSWIWLSPWPRTAAATSSARPATAWKPPANAAGSAAADRSSTTTSAPPSSTGADAANPSAPSPPASRSPSASSTRPSPKPSPTSSGPSRTLPLTIPQAT
ncbi:hypothetical protein [Actinomadura rubrisoli]|uniref:hypothetical protein n=1 Tax=Actinomadura rubrisoli TaxID=2530368 RepID=UPI001FB60D5A|nr:hypothetical protein [Actinomadura rubrisoli]